VKCRPLKSSITTDLTNPRAQPWQPHQSLQQSHWRHYLAVVQRKPGALRNGAPFLEMPEAFRQLQGHLLKRLGGDREMVEILALVLQHNEQAVLSAVELALEAGVPTKTHILNVLHRLIDGKAPPASPIDAPQALRLAQEPVADVERYDTLRALRHAS
ncbi:hypothetical protein ACQKPB_22505, partial [Sphingomonas sp. NPDC085925]